MTDFDEAELLYAKAYKSDIAAGSQAIRDALRAAEERGIRRALDIARTEKNLPGECPPDIFAIITSFIKMGLTEEVIRAYSGGMQTAIVGRIEALLEQRT